MLIGYARVSARDQKLELQREILTGVGCQEMFMDGAGSDQPALTKALDALREGDTIVVWKLDRLGCDAGKLIGLMNNLRQRGIHFRSLADAINTDKSSGTFFFHIAASLGNMERDLEAERPVEPKAIKRFGRKKGRKSKMTEEKIELAKRLLADGLPLEETAKSVGVSLSTIYRWVPPPKLFAKREFEINISEWLTPIHKKSGRSKGGN
jgi:DNA invertase Pin-like site-specific DNA recombinase